MENIRILIVEDDFIIGADIAMQLSVLGYDIAGIISNGQDALKQIDNSCPELILMDIQLKGEMDGVVTARQIYQKHKVPIIFLTANADDATYRRAKQTKPYAFISKPFSNTDLTRTIELALDKMTELNSQSSNGSGSISHLNQCFALKDRVFIRNKERHVKINIEDILYLEAERNYSKFHTPYDSYLMSMPLKSLEKRINKPQFIRIHRSFVINVMHLDEVLEDYAVIKGRKVPLSRSYKSELFQCLKTV